MRNLLSVLSLLLLGAAPPPQSVDYELAPVMAGEAITALAVTVRFRGDPSGTTRFDWPEQWAGEEKLGQWARDLSVEGAQSSVPAPHGGRIITAAPGARLTVRYRIVSGYPADPSATDNNQSRPIVRPTWFYGVGEALFGLPQGRDSTPARFKWSGPSGLAFASDLEHERARPRMKTKTLDDISESIVIGGRDLRVTRSTAAGAPLRVASIGKYNFDIAAFDRLAGQTIAAERGFWKDRDDRPFLITMVPLVNAPNQISYGGTGRSDAFALWMDTGADMSGLAWLLAHEYFHSWNARQLGRMDADGPEAESYWLSEGFTDFYARRLMLRAGLITPQQFVESWNDALGAYAKSAFRTAGNAAVAKAFWQNREAEKLPYQRGAMLAALWDQRQRAAAKPGLDTILQDQRRRVAGMTTPPGLTATFARVAIAHGLDVRPDVARFITAGEAVLLPRDTFGSCAAVETVTRPVFARGYDPDATTKADNVVTGLDPQSPAYAAGLRNGMKIVRRVTGKPGDSRVEYQLLVKDGATERTIAFQPAGKASESFQELVLDQARFARDPQGCAASLAG